MLFPQLLIVTAALAAPQQSALTEARTVDPSTEARVLVEATHARLAFDRDIVRYAVGRAETLSVESLTSRELLVLGESVGRTSLHVWFADGETETFLFAVQPDLTILRDALRDIHPSIGVVPAPDRDTLVLRGTVPDVSYSRAAEAAARAYLASSEGEDGAPPLVVVGTDETDGAVRPAPVEGRRVRTAGEGAVINLIRLATLPPLADQRIRDALAPLAPDVVVRRVTRTELPDDARDLFVLEGAVPDQVTLARVLFLASGVLLGESDAARRNDIRVLADEGGALTEVQNLFGSAAVGGGIQQITLGNSGAAGSGGGNAQNSGLLLSNRIGANLGRAKVVQAADGRILSLIEVEHLPLVRVDVRLYEVNLARLREWRNDLGVILSDFDQGALLPADAAVDLQGFDAAFVGDGDVQNVVRYLDGGITNGLQLVEGGLAVENVFELLVTRDIARAVSRPSLTVLSGELALFQVGGEVPVPVAVTVGGGTDQILNGVEFREFGVQLAIRPLVEQAGSERITLDLTPRVSLPDLQLTAALRQTTGTEVGTTAFESRAARTHARLLDGQALVIGGLITRREDASQGKTPWLGDIPGLGWLFRNEIEQAEELELVIVVSPVIVRPESPEARLWSFTEPGDVLAECLRDVSAGDAETNRDGRRRDGSEARSSRELPEP